MFYNELKTIKACEEDPSLIFDLIKEGHFELVDKLLSKKIVSVNEVDSASNDVITRLLKARQYDLVLKYMKNKKGETLLDKAINENYIYTTLKILEDKRFNNKNISNTFIRIFNYNIISYA